jgi:NAD(P)H-hydrate epimerase
MLAPARPFAENPATVAVTCAEMRAIEQRAFADGIGAEVLMEEAGESVAAAVRQFMPRAGRCIVFFGKGHNGGDALVAARYLAAAGWKIELRAVFPPEQWAPLTSRKHVQLVTAHPQAAQPPERARREPLAVLDGLLGIGSGGALREPIRSAAQAINHLSATSTARVFAIDLPSGLDADTGEADADTVEADYTLTIGAPKKGLLSDEAINHVGRLAVLPLEALTARMVAGAGPIVGTPASLAPIWPRRPFDIHKGDCGRVGVVAGSLGLTGAAVMCAEAAVHAGAGLVTLYVPQEVQPIVAASVAPEIMVQVFTIPRVLAARAHSALAVGPGVGRAKDTEILDVIARAPLPTVIDADALNALASRSGWLSAFPGPRLVTPHPGEMERLFAGSIHLPRKQVAEEFVARYPVALLLKGSRTIVAERDKPLSYNTTGTPGLASGGMGDVLTGVCAALAGQGLQLYDAARLGAWLCGRAGELAILGGESEESLSATHVIRHLGAAFRELREGGY